MASRAPTREAWHLQVVLPSSSDSSPSLKAIFPTSNRRYLFHVPEGSSRACTQSRITMGVRKLQDVFLPSVSTDHAGGLAGMILASVEKGAGRMRVHGPVGTEHLVASSRLFLKRKELALDVREVGGRAGGWEKVVEDANLAVYALPVAPSRQSYPPERPRKRKSLSRSPSPPSKRPNGHAATTNGAVDDLDWRSPRFKPSSLTGEAASRWRRLVISDMFRLDGGVLLPTDFTSPSSSALTSTESPELQQLEESDRGFGKRPNVSSPAYSRDRLPSLVPSPAQTGQVLSYLAIGPPQRGRFLAEKAKALGVKPGPDFAKLTKGEKVEAEGGRWVGPDECMEGGERPSAFMVATCPSRDHIASLASPAWPGRADEQVEGHPLFGAELKVVVHVAGPGVLDDDAYRGWIRSGFPSTTKHYIGSVEHSPDHPPFAPAALQQLRLSRLSPSIFPLPHHSALPASPPPPSFLPLVHGACIPLTSSTIPSKSADQSLSHIRRFDFSVPSARAEEEAETLKTANDTEREQIKGKKAWAAYLEALEVAREEVAKGERERVGKDAGPAGDLVVTTLGTGSAIPSKYRNVSATLVHVPVDDAYFLLDCGEGTVGQLLRRFGPAPSPSILRRLRLVFVSHLHADHHTGLSALLARRRRFVGEGGEKLVLVAPYGVWLHLQERSDLEDLGLETIVFVDANRVLRLPSGDEEGDGEGNEEGKRSRAAEKRLDEAVPELEVKTVVVKHAGRCFGVVVRHRLQRWKLVFSGDTRPHDGLVEAGLDADLLIHEATIDDSMPELADFKGHSTIGQAIDIARRMRARHCLLTHFSARYPKLAPNLFRPTAAPTDEGPVTGLTGVTGVETVLAPAFDMMTIRVSEMWKMAGFLPALEALFSDGEEDVDVVRMMDNGGAGTEEVVEDGKVNGGKGGRQTEAKRQRKEAWEKQGKKQKKARA